MYLLKVDVVVLVAPSLFTSTSFHIWNNPRSQHARQGSRAAIATSLVVSALIFGYIIARVPLSVTSIQDTMFRTAARSFATTAWRSAETLGQIEAAQQTAISISKAQGIGQRGFLDGNTLGHTTPQIGHV